AGVYAFSLDPDAPQVAAALERGGRAAVLHRGSLVLRGGRPRAAHLARADELPVAFAGLSRYNVANALAAAAAADALGIPTARIAEGLRTFALDSAANPGRLNLYERRGMLALVDFAHNEAGLAGLLEVCRGLTRGAGRRRGKVRLALGTAGDRTDEILHNLGVLAGQGADEVVICEKRHYLRGRDLKAMNAIFRAGVAEGGYTAEVEAFDTELGALQALVERSRRGDVVAVMAHVERSEIFSWLPSVGFEPVDGNGLRRLMGG
ncbi:MAG TPA: cyanophycin synthetase, partial [Candidatus Binatia bacterium]|nr:cyanophycin synthetase [Candidatus Binatia bacterium]